MNDWNIIGHDWAVRRLRQQIDGGQLAQSHLFVGSPSVGKAALALALARAILARDARDPARARRLVDSFKHPDLTWVAAQEGSVKVEQIRDTLHALTLAPVEGAHRLAVIDDAHLATDSSKNAILKTLEEPNPSSVIVLIAPSTDGVLPTITSRCQVLNLRPVAMRTIAEALARLSVDPARADLLARLARGRPGWALRAHADEEMLNERAQRLTDLEELLRANRTKRFEYSESLSKAGEETMVAVLDEWLLYWRDVVRACGAGLQPDAARDKLHNIDRADAILRLAGMVDTRDAARMLRAITVALKHIQQNASPRLALDALMLGMPVV
jgi:DNA polymerase III subunit delta'